MFLSASDSAAWNRDGFFLVRGFSSSEACDAMLRRAIDLAREADGRGVAGAAIVHPERNLAESVGPDARAEERVSKVFKIHRDSVFHEFATQPDLVEAVEHLLGTDIDCFLSQFIFKNPGAWGQPWHQDAFYFHFDRSPQVGIWLAVTEANLDNGPLRILPRSHTEPVHDVVPDRREHANLGYVEIVDTDTSEQEPVLMQPGDLLFFHSHLLHCSTDNASKQMRAAMVYHFASAATRDLSMEKIGFVPPNMDWMPVRRGEDTGR